MTVLERAHASGVSSSTSPRSVTKPAGIQNDDLILLTCHLTAAIAPSTFPSGFTLVESTTDTPGIFVYSKIADGSEAATFTFTFASGQGIVDMIVLYSDTATPLIVNDSASQHNASSTDREFPSVTTTKSNAYLACFGALSSNVASAPPSGMTEIIDNNAGLRNYLMVETVASTGATGTRTATGTAAISVTATIAVVEDINFIGADITLGALTLVATATAPVTADADITLGAVTSSGEGATPPATPTGFTATPISASRIDLAWAQSGSNFDGFELERSPNGSTGWALIVAPGAADRSYSDTGLAANTTYYYRLRSFRN